MAYHSAHTLSTRYYFTLTALTACATLKGFGEDQPPKASIKPSIDGAPLTVLATPSSETGVGLLFRAKTANAKIEEWKPLGAFPAKEAFRAYTQVNTAQSRQEFFPVQHLEMEIHPDMIWVTSGKILVGQPVRKSGSFRL